MEFHVPAPGDPDYLTPEQVARIKRERQQDRRRDKQNFIDRLIRPPRRIFEGVDWSKVQPSNGDAGRDRLVAARFSRPVPLRGSKEDER